jgi:hypothetical protein
MSNCYGHEKSTKRIARETGLSILSVQKILKKHSFRKIKPIRKPKLTVAMKSE